MNICCRFSALARSWYVRASVLLAVGLFHERARKQERSLFSRGMLTTRRGCIGYVPVEAGSSCMLRPGLPGNASVNCVEEPSFPSSQSQKCTFLGGAFFCHATHITLLYPPFLASLPFFPFARVGASSSGGARSGRGLPSAANTPSAAILASTRNNPYRFEICTHTATRSNRTMIVSSFQLSSWERTISVGYTSERMLMF